MRMGCIALKQEKEEEVEGEEGAYFAVGSEGEVSGLCLLEQDRDGCK